MITSLEIMKFRLPTWWITNQVLRTKVTRKAIQKMRSFENEQVILKTADRFASSFVLGEKPNSDHDDLIPKALSSLRPIPLRVI